MKHYWISVALVVLDLVELLKPIFLQLQVQQSMNSSKTLKT